MKCVFLLGQFVKCTNEDDEWHKHFRCFALFTMPTCHNVHSSKIVRKNIMHIAIDAVARQQCVSASFRPKRSRLVLAKRPTSFSTCIGNKSKNNYRFQNTWGRTRARRYLEQWCGVDLGTFIYFAMCLHKCNRCHVLAPLTLQWVSSAYQHPQPSCNRLCESAWNASHGDTSEIIGIWGDRLDSFSCLALPRNNFSFWK